MMRLAGNVRRYICTAAVVTVAGAVGFALVQNTAIAELAAGVAIFLFGMRCLEDGFQAFTGGTLEKLLERSTQSPLRSLFFGLVTTTLMQSSSLVSVVTISFLSAGLIGLAAGIGIVFGANLGTTSGAWLIAGFGLKVDIATYAMPMLAMGIALILHPNRSIKGLGNILSGIGFLFLGIAFMKEGFEIFRQGFDLGTITVTGLKGIALFVLLGTVATVVMQSSHATLVLILTALNAGQIGMAGAIALAIGANIGTTITAIIGALGANIQGKRLAVAHLFFNVVIGTFFIFLMTPVISVVHWLSMILGIAETDNTLQLAVFHTVFNGCGVILLTPLIPNLVRWLERLLPMPEAKGLKPRYLTPATQAFPETLNQALRLELIRLYDNAIEIMAHGLHLHRRVLFGKESLETALEHSRTLIVIDLDSQFAERVESLSAAIISATSHTSDTPPEQAETLKAFQDACLDIILCVKETKHLRRDLTTYVQHDNLEIRAAYNQMRRHIGNALRAIDQLRKEPPEHRDLLELEALRVAFTRDDPISSGQLDRLIRQELITPRMGMSLLHDLRYTQRIVWALVNIGRTLFGEVESTHSAVERLLGLSEADIARLARGPS